jgi:transglutaminase-like putative cysteine protease
MHEVYSTDSGNVRTMRGWILSDGRTTELGRAEIADIALDDNDVYNESRARVLKAPATLLTPGVVFGAETEIVERTVFTQFEWPLQERWPVLTARRTLTLPQGWDARSVTFNHAAIEPTRSGTSFAWELRDIGAVPDEPAGPPSSSLVPRVAVTYMPARRDLPTFDDWASVSKWMAMLAEAQAATDASMIAKARTLTAGASTEIDRIRAIGRYVQGVQYISIQTGLGRGGGYKPHAAVEVFAKNYGDCKDKANLLRAMLASVGIRAYLVAIYAGDRSYVRAEWPSPQQFNHAIVAVAVGRDTQAPSVQDQGTLGRLLFFDPTDEQTPVGELPMHLQASQGLLVAAEGGRLIRMPDSTSEANPTIRRVEATMTADGTLRATFRRASAGHPASIERQIYRELRQDQYLRMVEAEVRRQIPGAAVTLGRVGDDTATNRFEVTMDVEAARYAQVLQGRLMIVRPPQLRELDLPVLDAAPRKTPILLEPLDERDALELTLPEDATVDELPGAVTRTAPFGSFTVRWEKSSGRVVRTLTLQVQRASVPAESSAVVRAFLDAFRDAEKQPVVLALKR